MDKEFTCGKIEFTYGYFGANCCTVNWNEDSKGYIKAKNDFWETMFKGRKEHFEQFLNDLKSGKLA